jgi:quinol monooxygenase YgiN
VLIRDTGDPRRFLSLGAWENAEAVNAWRQTPEFSELLGQCLAVCDHFEPYDYTLAASPSR